VTAIPNLPEQEWKMFIAGDGWDFQLDTESRRGYLPLSLPAGHNGDDAVSVVSVNFSGLSLQQHMDN
jgi:hypothetical protein